eukprot:scaffold140394_cov35-Prasinocladus_malaysianus.AAC.1
MEDRHVVVSKAGGLDDGPMLLGVFDGHRGAEAAVYVSENLERELGLAWASSASPGHALRTAFLNLDRGFVASQAILMPQQHASLPLLPTAEVLTILWVSLLLMSL